MILDKAVLLADDQAYSTAASSVLDLGTTRSGPGEKVKLFVQGSADLATCTGFTITDGATNSAADALITHIGTLAGKIIEVDLPSDVARYVKVTITTATSLTAGTWTCGVVMPGVQTNL